ncbi:MAG: hypothetical protein QOG80_3133 [Pseudonocardiales bacterium]|nr:hypothetical protein [Pseudonocardiales bacterium]
MTRTFRPITPERLIDELADRIAGTRRQGAALRVAIDGAAAAGTATFAAELVAPLRERGCPATVVRAETFWRDASLRLEYGHEDPDAFLHWLDVPALRREVLDPLGPSGVGRFLPSLRDPATNRATRATPIDAEPNAVVLVAGALLFGSGLPFDYTVHLALTSGAVRRRTPSGEQWTLPALASYERETRPADLADLVVRLDDPARPAVGG